MGRGEALHVRRAPGHPVSSLPCPAPRCLLLQQARPPPLFQSLSKRKVAGDQASGHLPGGPRWPCVRSLGRGAQGAGPPRGPAAPLVLLRQGWTAVGAGRAHPTPGARAADPRLPGLWGGRCQGLPGARAGAWRSREQGRCWTRWAGGRERPPTPSSGCPTCEPVWAGKGRRDPGRPHGGTACGWPRGGRWPGRRARLGVRLREGWFVLLPEEGGPLCRRWSHLGPAAQDPQAAGVGCGRRGPPRWWGLAAPPGQPGAAPVRVPPSAGPRGLPRAGSAGPPGAGQGGLGVPGPAAGLVGLAPGGGPGLERPGTRAGVRPSRNQPGGGAGWPPADTLARGQDQSLFQGVRPPAPSGPPPHGSALAPPTPPATAPRAAPGPWASLGGRRRGVRGPARHGPGLPVPSVWPGHCRGARRPFSGCTRETQLGAVLFCLQPKR